MAILSQKRFVPMMNFLTDSNIIVFVYCDNVLITIEKKIKSRHLVWRNYR